MRPYELHEAITPRSAKAAQQAEIDRLKAEFFARGGQITQLGTAAPVVVEHVDPWIDTWAACQILGRERSYLDMLVRLHKSGEIQEIPRTKLEGRRRKWFRADIEALEKTARKSNGR